MSVPRLERLLLDAIRRRKHRSRALRLAVTVPPGTPAGFVAELLAELGEAGASELHLAGPERLIAGCDPDATVHPAENAAEIDAAVGALNASGTIDAILLLPLPDKPDQPFMERAPELGFGPERLTGVSLFAPGTLNRPLLIADSEISDVPDTDRHVQITDAAAAVARTLAVEIPRAAVLAAVEVANPGLPVTVQAAEVAQRHSGRDGMFVEGPLSLDLAINPSAVEKKGVRGEVPGRADVLVAPNLTVARAVRDALVHGCGIPGATAIVGGRVPAAVAARGETARGVRLAALFAIALVE